jgi:hypothetical protein
LDVFTADSESECDNRAAAGQQELSDGITSDTEQETGVAVMNPEIQDPVLQQIYVDLPFLRCVSSFTHVHCLDHVVGIFVTFILILRRAVTNLHESPSLSCVHFYRRILKGLHGFLTF